MKIYKKCVVVAVFYGDTVLVVVDQHQGYEILDLLGAVVREGEGELDAAKRALADHIDGEYNLIHHGSFTSFITKPEGTVELVADAYIVRVDNVALIKKVENRPTIWLTRDQLFQDPRNRRNNRLFDKFFDYKPVNLILHEDQMGLWIDAKITEWTED